MELGGWRYGPEEEETFGMGGIADPDPDAPPDVFSELVREIRMTDVLEEEERKIPGWFVSFFLGRTMICVLVVVLVLVDATRSSVGEGDGADT